MALLSLTLLVSFLGSRVVGFGGNVTCGTNQPPGYQTCALGTCCSSGGQYCGIDAAHCDPGNCNPEYGHCGLVSPPSCRPSSNTSNSRTVGYYQISALTRACDVVTPQQLNTKGLSHINYAFLGLDAASCAVAPGSVTSYYTDFVGHKSSNLETWISVGGGGDDVAKNWSAIASTKACREAFATSLLGFLEKYGFQGADIDWEGPNSQADMENFVTLLMDIYNDFGGTYGLSAYLPADFGSLLAYDPANMAKYLNWFNVGTYDLNEAQTNPQQPSPFMDAQTNATEIEIDLTPLWYAGIEPSTVNLGLAYYGRSYTLRSPSCAHAGAPCHYTGPGAAGQCTQEAGVLSNQEIQSLISTQNLTPKLYSTAKVKSVVYNTNSLVFYDDSQTFTLKRRYANSRCLGGTMIWSLDFNNVGKQ